MLQFLVALHLRGCQDDAPLQHRSRCVVDTPSGETYEGLLQIITARRAKEDIRWLKALLAGGFRAALKCRKTSFTARSTWSTSAASSARPSRWGTTGCG